VKVAVVGGGVIGLACAWYLQEGGAEVVVLERDSAGMAASRGNAGWISPGLSNPLPAPGVTRQAMRWMLRSDSPFLLRPRLDSDFASWLWRFWRSSSRARYLAGMQAMLALNERTLELYDRLVADGVEFEMHKDGLLFLFLGERAAEEEAAVLEDLQRHGYPGDVRRLTVPQAQELDPAIGDGVKGAFLAAAERHVRPESLTAGISSALRETGVELREGVEVTGIAANRTGWRLRAADEEIRADKVLVAAGAWTGRVLAPLGVKIRQEAAKGYSLTAQGEGTRPRHPLYLGEAKVGCSPFEAGVRLAGTLELSGIDLSPNRGRLDAVARAATRYLRDWRPVTPELEWAGLRPLPPDGLPLIGPVPGRDGLFVATGHGMMGVTLAPATGAALTPLVLEDRLVPELRPFGIDR
jgi:D-amino-acid dehydrogenase